MPLLDHFHPPVYSAYPWTSFHGLWSAALAERFNETLPTGYYAAMQAHFGGGIEVDVVALEGRPLNQRRTQPPTNSASGSATAVAELPATAEPLAWTPPAADAVLPIVFPDEVEVLVYNDEAALVAAIELVSPSNKDRSEARVGFAGKCVSLLQRGVGLIIVDIVTSRSGDLPAEIAALLGQTANPTAAPPASLSATAYRPFRRASPAAGATAADGTAGLGSSADAVRDGVEIWQRPLSVGSVLPVLPLALRGSLTLAVDLEVSYTLARRRSRLG